MKNRKIITGYIFVMLSAVIFGLMPLMTKFIYKEGVNSESLVFLRSALAIPALFVLALVTKSSVKIKPSKLPMISFMAMMGCCVTPLLLFISYNYIPSGTATVFHFVYPAVVAIGEYVFLKTKLKGAHVLSVLFCVVGIFLFYNGGGINVGGSILALLSGFAYAVYVVSLSGYKNKDIPTFTFALYVALVCSVAMFILCLVSGTLAFPSSLKGWLLVVLFAFLINVVAVVLFQKGTFLIGGGRASILSTLEPVTGVIAGAIVFSEKVNIATVFGTALVVTASVLIAVLDMKSENKDN